MDHPRIYHHGGARGVTGSCHQLMLDKQLSLLVDCGLFQGKEAEGLNPDTATGSNSSSSSHSKPSSNQHTGSVLEIEFPIEGIVALVVTHVHIDHIGRLPYLLAAGFKGPIICSEPSARLLPLVIEDALKIGFTRNQRLIERFLAQVEQQLLVLPYKRWHKLVSGPETQVRVKLHRAGHILGSAYVEVDIRSNGKAKRSNRDGSRKDHRVLFSGDLGAPWSPLLPAPRAPYRADTLVLESTYGDRLHSGRRDRCRQLEQLLVRSVEQQGCLIIPAFSIGRTQELLYELEGLIYQADDTSPLKSLEVIVDSPLAARFTEVYRQLKPFWDGEAHRRLRQQRHPLSFDGVYTVDSHEAHLQTVDYLSRKKRPAVIIAASGMASGGRVVNYLKAMLPESRHQVLFVGYQAAGTPGADILRYGRSGDGRSGDGQRKNGWVALDGQRYTIAASVHQASGYSAHADQGNLVNFVKRMRVPPQKIHLVHGDYQARSALKQALSQQGVRADIHLP